MLVILSNTTAAVVNAASMTVPAVAGMPWRNDRTQAQVPNTVPKTRDGSAIASSWLGRQAGPPLILASS